MTSNSIIIIVTLQHLTGAICRRVLVPSWMEAFSPGGKCDHDESVTTRQSWESLICNILQMVSIISVLVLKALPVIALLYLLSRFLCLWIIFNLDEVRKFSVISHSYRNDIFNLHQRRKCELYPLVLCI